MNSPETTIERDLASNFTRMLINWGPGILFMITTGPLGGWARVVGWTVGLTWLGGMCMLNFARCRRVHCIFTGPFFFALAALTVLGGVGVVPFTNNAWNLLGLASLVGGVGLTYAPEKRWGRYWRATEKDGDIRL